jgi:CheY-like chemotaxis protein
MPQEPFASERIVLCVDDDVAFLKMVRMYLEAYDYVVLTETSGQDAIRRALTAHSLYAVVLDYVMPGLLGTEVSAAIRQTKPEIPIIIFSGLWERISPDALRNVDIVVDKERGIGALLQALKTLGNPPVAKSFTPRKFPRFTVNLPIVVDVERSGGSVTINGIATSLSEGGIGSQLEAELLPGEFASIAIRDEQLNSLRPRAQLRYRHHDTYGFAFVGLSESQQQVIQQSCKRLALN